MIGNTRSMAVSAERRMHRSWADDGLVDVCLGAFFCVGSLCWWATTRIWWIAGLGILAPVVVYVPENLLWGVKRRLSDLRVWHVRPRQIRLRRRVWIALFVRSVLLQVVQEPLWRAMRQRLSPHWPILQIWWPVLLMGFTGASFAMSWFLGYGPRRHLLVSLIGTAGAVAGPLLGLRWDDSLSPGAEVLGLTMSATGLAAQGGFPRDRPPSADG